MQTESSYICDSCGEEIIIPLDLSAGESQQYVEDCPVCCRPNVIHVESKRVRTALKTHWVHLNRSITPSGSIVPDSCEVGY